MNTNSRARSKIFIAGHKGLVGSAFVRFFKEENVELILAARDQVDLTDQKAVENFLRKTGPDIVIVSAGRVGGIQENTKYPAEFIYQNLMIEANIIHAAFLSGVKKMLNFGSSCIYPNASPQPMKPEYLFTDKIESTNEPYATAKIAGMSLCNAYNKQYGTKYINAIPSNLYGPGDTFDLNRCHVLSAMIRKFFEARENKESKVTLWGSGNVLRDFLYVDDLPKACWLLLENEDIKEPINIGSGRGTSIQELARAILEIVGFQGDVIWDTTRPDGAPARILDIEPIQKLGWQPSTNLKEGLKKTFEWFLKERLCVS